MRPLIRQSWHPVMACQMLTLAAISCWQLLGGLSRHETTWHVPSNVYMAMALVTLLGCVGCLSATVQSDSWTAAAYELTGCITLVTVLGIDLWFILTTNPYPGSDLVTGLTAGLWAGLVWRSISITKDAIMIVKEQRSPPVGDLDLLAVGQVDSATALAMGPHIAQVASAAKAIAIEKSDVEGDS
jgi:hypothetical protein